MNPDIVIFIVIVGTIVLSALIVWSVGDTRRHNQRQSLKRRLSNRGNAKKEK